MTNPNFETSMVIGYSKSFDTESFLAGYKFALMDVQLGMDVSEARDIVTTLLDMQYTDVKIDNSVEKEELK